MSTLLYPASIQDGVTPVQTPLTTVYTISSRKESQQTFFSHINCGVHQNAWIDCTAESILLFRSLDRHFFSNTEFNLKSLCLMFKSISPFLPWLRRDDHFFFFCHRLGCVSYLLCKNVALLPLARPTRQVSVHTKCVRSHIRRLEWLCFQ